MHVDGGLECVAGRRAGDHSREARRRHRRQRDPVGRGGRGGSRCRCSPATTAALPGPRPARIPRSGGADRRGAARHCSTTQTTYSTQAVAGAARRGRSCSNLIHEVNNLLSLVGPIGHVPGRDVNATQKCPSRDTAAMVFSFRERRAGHVPAVRERRGPPRRLVRGSRRRRRTPQLRRDYPRRGLLPHRGHPRLAVRPRPCGSRPFHRHPGPRWEPLDGDGTG